MIQPIGQERAEQIGPSQKRAVRRRRSAQDDMIAAARSGMATIEHEFLGAQPALPRLIVQTADDLLQFLPIWAGCTLTSITPGSGVTLSTPKRGS